MLFLEDKWLTAWSSAHPTQHRHNAGEQVLAFSTPTADELEDAREKLLEVKRRQNELARQATAEEEALERRRAEKMKDVAVPEELKSDQVTNSSIDPGRFGIRGSEASQPERSHSHYSIPDTLSERDYPRKPRVISWCQDRRRVYYR